MYLAKYLLDITEFTDAENGEALLARAFLHIDEERRRKAHGIRPGKARAASVGAGLLLQAAVRDGDREACSQWRRYSVNELMDFLQEKPPLELAYVYGREGKPYFRDLPFYFNLSHSGGMAVAVFADTAVGCDVERIEAADLPLARQFFSEGEYRYLAGLPAGQQRDAAFYRLWTLKESFVKTIGAGLALPLDAFEIVIMAGESGGKHEQIEVRQNVDPAARYLFGEYCFGGYSVSVCLHCNRYRKKCEWCLNEQMDQKVCCYCKLP